MSATRDKTQKITFVYSNLYSIYRKGVERARSGGVQESSVNQPSLAAEALNHLALGQEFTASRRLDSGAVLKAKDLRQAGSAYSGLSTPLHAPAAPQPQAPAPKVSAYSAAELIGKRVARPTSLPPVAKAPASAVESLKENLKSLNDLQARLRFMLQELEELIKE